MKRFFITLLSALVLPFFYEGSDIFGQIATKKYETRAVWLTTIYGLDWPSSQYPASQKRQLSSMLDRLQELGINTVFLQVRGRGDLIYPSKIEPVNLFFSEDGHLTYDPLKFAIEECRKRGMSIHAWVVAIPIGNKKNAQKLGNRHFARRHPGAVFTYNGSYYMDPGDPRTTEHLQAIAKELLDNYDLDGIHLDYIRYPERSLGKLDRKNYDRASTPLSYEEWRRSNITKVVKGIHDTVHATDSLSELSAAVIGTYKPNVPGCEGEIGWNAYSAVHQDPVRWAKEGAIDFVVPMHYMRGAKFWPVIKQWRSVMDSIPVLIGIGAYRVLPNEGDWPDREIIDQTTLVQADTALMGMCFFRADQVTRPASQRYTRLRDENFRSPTLPFRPLSGELDTLSLETAPVITGLTQEKDGIRVKWEIPKSSPRDLFAIYATKEAENIDLTKGELLRQTTSKTECLVPWSDFGIEAFSDSTEYLLTLNVTRYDLHSGIENVYGKGQVIVIRPTQEPAPNTEGVIVEERRSGE